MKSAKPIFVTGSHCSGTTWVGRMIAASPDVTYIHEPFNVKHDMGICSARFERWFTYICEENGLEYYDSIKDTVSLRYHPLGLFRLYGEPKYLGRATRNYARFIGGRARRNRALLKDPIALFSAEWLSSSFDMDTIMMIRHPAAFAGSVKVKNRSHPFNHFLEQPLLMQEHLYPFEEEIHYFADEERDIIDQAAMLWKLIHYMILKYKETNPEWIYVRHEDLSLDPLHGFEGLYDQIGLEYSQSVSDVIRKHSSSGGSSNGSNSEYHFKKLTRESASNIHKWKERLSTEEIRRIRSQVQEVSREFYSDDEW